MACEVKDLARPTARATDDVAAIHAANHHHHHRHHHHRVDAVPHQIPECQSLITAADEEQDATTHDMSRNASLAAAGAGYIAASFTVTAVGNEGIRSRGKHLARAGNHRKRPHHPHVSVWTV